MNVLLFPQMALFLPCCPDLWHQTHTSNSCITQAFSISVSFFLRDSLCTHHTYARKTRRKMGKILRIVGFPGSSLVKTPPANAGDAGSIPGLGRSPGGGNGNPLQYSCLENPMDIGAWRATVHGVTKSQRQLSN